MVISVIQEGKGVLHFAGELDPYNIQLVTEHTANHSPNERREIRIALNSSERDALTPESERLLKKLATGGLSISEKPRRKEGRF